MPGTEVLTIVLTLSACQVSRLVSASEGDELDSRSECGKRPRCTQGVLGGLRTQCGLRAMEVSWAE